MHYYKFDFSYHSTVMCFPYIQKLNPMQNYAVRYLLYQSRCIVLPICGNHILIRIWNILKFQMASAYSCMYAAEHVLMIQQQGFIESKDDRHVYDITCFFFFFRS